MQNLRYLFFICTCLIFFSTIGNAKEIMLTHSKEYQIVLKNKPWATFDKTLPTLLQTLQTLEDNPYFQFRYKSGSGKYTVRYGTRYDTPDGLLSATHLNLKIELSHKNGEPRSKLKLKYNCSDPDACLNLKHSERAFSYPAAKYADKARFKLELDMHQNYAKYGAGGSIKFKKQLELKTLGDAQRYFPQLKHVPGFDADTPLISIKQYYEKVFDDIKVKFAGYKAKAALVVRYHTMQSEMPERAEFSFKLKRSGETWQQPPIVALGQVYAYFLNSDWNALKGTFKPGEFLLPVERK